MDLFQSIDIYCERLGPQVWAEPLNALSNLGFLVAAVVLASRLGAQHGTRVAAHRYLRLLAALVFCIGVGSALFHTTAQVWSAFLDVLFISLFIYAFFGFFLHFVAGLGWGKTVLALAAFFALNWGIERGLRAALAPAILNGSEGYVPPLVALAAMAIYMVRSEREGARRLLLAASVFAVSLGLRSLDQRWCAALPIGTHFMWHLLNALTLFLAVTAMSEATLARRRGPTGGL